MDFSMVFLVVDDLDGMRRIVARNLSQMGLKSVVMAGNGAEAWRIIQSQPIHAVITDWNMPVMTGLQLLKTIRASAEFCNLPVLMMTAETERHQVKLAIEAGVSDFMIKPFNVSSLEAKLKKVISKPRPVTPMSAPLSVQPVPKPPLATRAGEPLAVALSASFKQNLSRQATLLVVDDMPDNLDVLIELLGDEYTVKAANSGERVLKILDSGKIPDLILLDVMMPEMDGFEVCRRIKANPATAEIPVIFLTAMSETTDVTRGFELGAVDFVTKPADPPILKARIRTHLKLKRTIDEVRRSHQTLVEQNTALEESLRLKEEVERISHHDMKNPIGGIINFSSMLLEDKTLNGDQQAIIKDIEQSAYSVLNMINLSLDLFKMEQGSYEFEPNRVDVTQVLQRILNEKKSELASRKIDVRFLSGESQLEQLPAVFVKGDELLCYSMLGNLFKNAMEAAGEHSTIRLSVMSDGARTTLRIFNTGTVPASIRSTFFDKFVTANKPGGTGLGTFSAKLIAETQKGGISMETSDENNTTVISVVLPSDTGEIEAEDYRLPDEYDAKLPAASLPAAST